MSADLTTAELAAEYWNAPETVREFAGLHARDYFIDLLDRMDGTVDGLALDLGCGGGRNTVAMLQHGFTVLALDLHQAMIEATRTAVADYPADQVSVHLAAADLIPAENDGIAFAVCYGVLHNALDRARWRASVAELARVLRPGAVLALNCFTSDRLDSRLRPGTEPGQYLLADGVPMMLLPSTEIIDAFAEFGMTPLGPVETYVRELGPGDRAVLRCELRTELT